jgi:hypothetical protein
VATFIWPPAGTSTWPLTGIRDRLPAKAAVSCIHRTQASKVSDAGISSSLVHFQVFGSARQKPQGTVEDFICGADMGAG